MEQLENIYIPRVSQYRFCQIMAENLPRLREEIKEISMSDLKDFLESIRKHSDKIGETAMRQVDARSRPIRIPWMTPTRYNTIPALCVPGGIYRLDSWTVCVSVCVRAHVCMYMWVHVCFLLTGVSGSPWLQAQQHRTFNSAVQKQASLGDTKPLYSLSGRTPNQHNGLALEEGGEEEEEGDEEVRGRSARDPQVLTGLPILTLLLYISYFPH